ncbi:MAG: ATP-dependent Clp protease proteolytic subunit [Gammaproteobacteria bacterium]|nr:ATP-dependent Clp protease proteolytic subunit [Gammaproteobacteria bacterium]
MKKPFITIAILSATLAFTAAVAKAEREAPLSIVVEAAGDKATIRITGYIHEWLSANAVDLGVQIDALAEAGHTEATVYINSKGGVTWEANEIVNTLRRFNGKLHAECGAMAFSAATYIACKMDTFKVHANSQFMWHRPKGKLEGSHDEIANNLKLLKDTENDYLKVYAAKTKKTEADLAALWANGDQWLMGQEIVDFGFADGLIASDAPVSAADVEILVAVGAPVVPVATATPKPTHKPTNTIDMNIDPTTIGLSATATEAEVNARLKELKAQADEATALKAEKTAKDKTERATAIKAALDAGQTARKFDTATRTELEALMTEGDAGFERGKKIIAGMAPVAAIGDELDTTATGTDITARKDWDLEKWQEKDPKGLQAAAEKKPEWFEKLVIASHNG